MRMSTSATRKIFTFVQKAERMSGKASSNSCRLKNACLTSSQPAELTTATATMAKSTAVDTRATATLRPPPPFVRLPRILEPRFSSSLALLQDRGALLPQPTNFELLQRAVRAHRVDRLVHAAHERVSLLEDDAEVLLRALRREPPDDGRARNLDVRDVAHAGEVVDQAVDLLVLERGDDVVDRVVDPGRLVRLDVLDDVVVARRPDRGSEPVLLQAGE